MSNFAMQSAFTDPTRGAIFCNNIEFNRRFTPERASLCPGALRMLSLPNAGGNSVWSEVFSVEILGFMHRVKLQMTEMELVYTPDSKITDFSITTGDGSTLGVSVTRAMKFQKWGEEFFTEEDAFKLLSKKLHGVNASTKGVVNQSWEKQILHVWTERQYMRDILVDTYHKLSDELKSNTIVLVTVAENAEWLFK